MYRKSFPLGTRSQKVSFFVKPSSPTPAVDAASTVDTRGDILQRVQDILARTSSGLCVMVGDGAKGGDVKAMCQSMGWRVVGQAWEESCDSASLGSAEAGVLSFDAAGFTGEQVLAYSWRLVSLRLL